MRRKRRARIHNEVELNLAAMLDMAFQILTFFILTFKPMPYEGQISLHMPPPQPITKVDNGEAAGADPTNPNPVQGLNTLIITVFGATTGQIDGLAIGESTVAGLGELEKRVAALLSDPGSGFDQVLIQVGSSVNYQSLLDVVDVCTRQKLADGKNLTKLNFVELPGG
jgi:biopolymer transport protein ExbD